ncbi:MAG: phenylalanine--tRNA ligase subunit beta [Ruminococcaceae bacterium]|nr:phenylalanine--tRNA ligase subunit beta [Oscillospiraceae bacterium]
MKLSMNWLKGLVPYDYEPKKYIADMTMSGSKVETLEYFGEEIRNVVVGRVVSMEHHPDSDHLWVCQIDVGAGEAIQIITGAQNVKVDDLVPVALHDSDLPGGVHIKKGKLRGLPSNGMLCSFNELAMTEHDVPGAYADGILILNDVFSAEELAEAPVGTDVRKLLGFDDWIVDFEITPNRPDCLSMIGLARESAVTYGQKYVPDTPVVKGGAGDIGQWLRVRVEEPKLCPRYTARVVKNVKIEPSPKWMRDRLRACGVRPINNIVDITNYVMLEYGQPMHSFDYACLDGAEIVVRCAKDGEIMNTLDDQERALDAEMLVIADAKKPVGVAGVMGGANSEITDGTKMIVFESANFNGTSIRLTSRRLGMRTESSGRYEKGLDPMNTLPALERACELVELLGAGEVCDGIIDIDNTDHAPKTIKFEPERINAFLGVDVAKEDMLHWFDLLGFQMDGENIVIPSWRMDVEQFADIAEEVARFYGYDNVPTTLFPGEARYIPMPTIAFDDRIRELFTAMGYSEAQTMSFSGAKSLDRIFIPEDSELRKAVVITNPLSEDMNTLRTIMLPSILEVAARNYNVKNPAMRMYELGSVYVPVDGEKLPRERKILSGAIYGDGADFFEMKGAVDALAAGLRMKNISYRAQKNNPSYHPGRCAEIYCGDTYLGVIGQVHPKVVENFNAATEIYAMELEVEALFANRGGIVEYEPLAKFPAITRDIAVVCNEDVTAAEIESCIREGAGKLLESVRLFDVYRGAQLGEGRKSMAYSFSMRDRTRSLTDEDADGAMKRILKLLAQRTGAELRA